MARKKKQRGGWPKRERSSFIVRADPEVAEWLTEFSEAARRSRNQTVEVLLIAMMRAMQRLGDPGEAVDAEPEEIVSVVGSVVVEELASVGLAPSFVRAAVEHVRGSHET